MTANKRLQRSARRAAAWLAAPSPEQRARTTVPVDDRRLAPVDELPAAAIGMPKHVAVVEALLKGASRSNSVR